MKFVIRLFFKTVRLIMGPPILLVDWLTTPKGIKRDPASQQEIDEQTRHLVLYQFKTCPFCIKVRRHMKRLSLNIERRDALRNMTHRTELLEGGGQIKVPCLRIVDDKGETTWLYESEQILHFLNANFGDRETVTA